MQHVPKLTMQKKLVVFAPDTASAVRRQSTSVQTVKGPTTRVIANVANVDPWQSITKNTALEHIAIVSNVVVFCVLPSVRKKPVMMRVRKRTNESCCVASISTSDRAMSTAEKPALQAMPAAGNFQRLTAAATGDVDSAAIPKNR